MAKRETGLQTLFLGAAPKGRQRISLIGGTIVEDYISNLQGGRVLVIKTVQKDKKSSKRKPKDVPAMIVAYKDPSVFTFTERDLREAHHEEDGA